MKNMIRLMCLALVACGGGKGSVQFTTWGEEYIEDKIPVDSMDAVGFVDDWSLSYSKFLVTFGEIKIADRNGAVAATQDGAKVFDLRKKGPVELVSFADLDAQRWDTVSYSILPSADSTAGNADAADVTLMHTNGYGVYVAATATKGSVTKTLSWGYTLNTLYEDCEQKEQGKGVVVPVGGSDTVQLTVHGDHIWYDDLQSETAKIRFQAYADADKDNDGVITETEVAAVQLTSLPLGQYGTGGASSVKTLKDFSNALSRTIGHYRGEGECAPKAR